MGEKGSPGLLMGGDIGLGVLLGGDEFGTRIIELKWRYFYTRIYLI